MKIGLLLCRLGLHEWRLSSGLGVTRGESRHMAIFYARDCRRCLKHEEDMMIV